MATNQQEAQTLEETLNKTDLGHVINENKKIIIIAGIVIFAAVIIYSLMSHLSEGKRADHLNRVFNVETTVFAPYTSGKIKAPEFVKLLGGVNNELVGDIALAPSFLEAVNKLETEKAIDANVIGTFDKWANRMDKSSYAYMFFGMRLVSLYENTAQFDKALAILESVKNTKYQAFQEKIHLDLGRMYLLTNQKAKAVESFNYIVEKFKDTEFAKLANLYLSKAK